MVEMESLIMCRLYHADKKKPPLAAIMQAALTTTSSAGRIRPRNKVLSHRAFLRKKVTQEKIIGIRTDFRIGWESSGAAVNEMIEMFL